MPRKTYSHPTILATALLVVTTVASADAVCVGVEAAKPEPLSGVEIHFDYTSKGSGEERPETTCRIASKQANLITVDRCDTEGKCGESVSLLLIVSGKLDMDELPTLVNCDLDTPDETSITTTVVSATRVAGESVDASTLSASVVASRCSVERE